MKKVYGFYIALILLFQIVFIPVNEVEATEYDDVRTTVVEFLRYLKNGDTGGILDLIVDPMLNERETLLRRNLNYPAILIEAYQKTTFQIVSVEKTDNVHYAVTVSHLVDDELIKKTKFICERGSNSWKISEEVRISN